MLLITLDMNGLRRRLRGAAPAGLLALALGTGAPGAAALTTCSVTATPLAFGNYDPINGGALSFSATVTVGCLAVTLPLGTVSYTVAVGPSATSGGMSRQMLGPLNGRLNYNIFTDTSYGVVWGDGSGATAAVSGGSTLVLLLALVNKTHTLHGRLPAGQVVRSGLYTDSLVVTVDY